MYVIIDKDFVVLGISEDLDYDAFDNPLIKNGTIGIIKELVGQIFENVQDIPEDAEENFYYFDGTTWTCPINE